MARSRTWRSRARRGSRRLFENAPTSRFDLGSAPIPVAGGSLADGFAVGIYIVVRLLGLRLLRLEGGIDVLPSRRPRGGQNAASPPIARSSTAPVPTRAIGGNLVEAQRLIDESAHVLERVRSRSGSAES